MTEGNTGHTALCGCYVTGSKEDCDCRTEQPHPCNYVNFKKAEQPNIIIFDQIEGCCDIIEKLLKELTPQTEDVKGCLITHEAWRNNNLKHLKGAFE